MRVQEGLKMYEINSFASYHDCECCGSYSCKDVCLSDGKNIIHTFEYESHFGGGNWNGDWQTIYAFILKDLGYKAVFSISLADCLEITQIEDDSSYYEYYKDEDLIPLEVHVVYKRHHYKAYDGSNDSYDLPFTFTFSLMNESHTIEVDEYKKFYEACVKLIADVHESHESKSYLDDSYDDY